MARRRVADETDAAAEKYDREEREAIQDEEMNRAGGGFGATVPEAPEEPARRRRAVGVAVAVPKSSDIDFRPPHDDGEPTSKAVEKSDIPLQSPASPPKASVTNNVVFPKGSEVTVVWGKELFSPASFHTFEVGPFSATVAVLEGETFSMAADRAMRDLRGWAEAERDRKKASYLRMVESTSKRG